MWREEGRRETRGTNPPGAILRSLPPERVEKEKERSKVRASGPDTDRFSRSRDTNEEEEKEEKEEREEREIKGSPSSCSSAKIRVAQNLGTRTKFYIPF